MNKGVEELLDTFLYKCLGKNNENIVTSEVREIARVKKVNTIMRLRRWKWIGHVLDMQEHH
jgi:hypothetical protein